MLKTNGDRLPILSVKGRISAPTASYPGRIDQDGRVFVLPGTGGITYNARIGDPACGWAADHLEPGVSTKCADEKENIAYNFLSCIGNEARVISGEAKGARGFVTGKHGGIEHVILYFAQEDLEKMAIGDEIQVYSQGQGMELMDWPEIAVRNLSPRLLERMGVREDRERGKLIVPVTHWVPATVMGSGLGSVSTCRGDYDITLFDAKTTEQYHLDTLRFGDIVLLEDCDTTYGRTFLTGAVTVGVVVHSDCRIMGHGPGVTTLFSCKRPLIEGVRSPGANLASYLLQGERV